MNRHGQVTVSSAKGRVDEMKSDVATPTTAEHEAGKPSIDLSPILACCNWRRYY